MLRITEISKNGENVILSCSGVGNTPVNVTWVTPNGEVQTNLYDGDEEFMWRAEDLDIGDIAASDGGSYTCTAENEEGSVNASIVVYVAPYFTTEPTDILTTNGSIETATCRAEAFPSPEIWWVASIGNCAFLASGSGSGESLVYEHLSDNENLVQLCSETGSCESGECEISANETLIFDPVLFGDENRVYCCVASNEYGRIYSSFQITGTCNQ